MSMWVGHDITAYGDRQAIGKFFNLDPEQDIHYIDHFDFSFGQKNVPGLRLGKLIEQNPDLMFLIKQRTDYDVTWIVERFNKLLDKREYVVVMMENFEFDGIKFNKLLLDKYNEEFPFFIEKHKMRTVQYDWTRYFNFEKISEVLNNSVKYSEMIDINNYGDLDVADDGFYDLDTANV